MPNFKKLMVNGIFSKNCITDFPSVTQPTQVSMITGTYTGDFRNELCHGIPLTNWMDRSYSPPLLRCYGANDFQIFKINEDLGENCKTILEMIDEGNKPSIIQFVNRGADYFFPKNKINLIYYYLLLKFSRNLKHTLAKINTGSIYKLLDTFKHPKKYFGNNETPLCSLLYLFSPDLLMHHFGYRSQIYKLNLMHIDKVIGILIEELNKLGFLEETVIVIASDHGNYEAQKVNNLNSFFEQFGLQNYHPRNNPKGNLNLAEFGGVGFFNFKGQNNLENSNTWIYPTMNELENFGPRNINLLETLFKIEGTDLMYFRNNENTKDRGIIYLKRKDQKTGKIYPGEIHYRGQGEDFKTKYIAEHPNNDIFGYNGDDLANKLIDDKFHSIDEWLEVTYHLDYPVYPDLVSRHFKNPRSSDIIISTRGNVVYNIEHGKQKNKLKFAHDIGLRSCSIVPLIISGSSEIPHKEIPYCKITDIVPTLLKMIGKKSHKSVVGKSLI